MEYNSYLLNFRWTQSANLHQTWPGWSLRSPVTNPTAHPQFIKLFSRTRNGTEIVFGMKYLLKWRFNLVQMKAPGSIRSKPWRSKFNLIWKGKNHYLVIFWKCNYIVYEVWTLGVKFLHRLQWKNIVLSITQAWMQEFMLEADILFPVVQGHCPSRKSPVSSGQLDSRGSLWL